MIVGFDFSKIVVERTSPLKKSMKVNNNLVITSVERKEFGSLGDDKKGIAVHFSYQVSYAPQVGALTLDGAVLYMDSEERISSIIEAWNSTKQLPQSAAVQILNLILTRCNVKALQLANDVGLPPQMQLPQVTAGSIS